MAARMLQVPISSLSEYLLLIMTAIATLLIPRLFHKTRRYLLCSVIAFFLVVGSAVQPLVALAQFAPCPPQTVMSSPLE
jgi:hypothetical protein